jgi:hypothetical protein
MSLGFVRGILYWRLKYRGGRLDDTFAVEGAHASSMSFSYSRSSKDDKRPMPLVPRSLSGRYVDRKHLHAFGSNRLGSPAIRVLNSEISIFILYG